MTEVAGNGAPAAAAEPSPFGRGPDPRFEVLGAEPVERAAAPTLRVRLRATDESGRRVCPIALSVRITLEPHSGGTRMTLTDGPQPAGSRAGEGWEAAAAKLAALVEG